MQFSVDIEGREVLAAGVLVIGADDRTMDFVLDGMRFTIELVHGASPVQAEFVRKNLKHMVVKLRGELPEFTAAWKLGALGRAGDRQIDLDLMIYSQSKSPNSIRQVSFSFTAHPGDGRKTLPEGAAIFT